jgi:hypothetical protein
MIHNPFNTLLRAEHEDAPPANPGTASPETQTGDEPEGGEKKDEDPDPESPAAPEASVKPAPLSAFERTRLRALGMGALISRVEKAEGDLAVANANLANANGENIRLTSELSKLKKETPVKIAEAQKGRADEVSKGVKAELTQLGITAEAAPSQVAAEADSSQSKTRAEFDAMKPDARTKFILAGGKLTD